jgi:hypothetical protein
MHVIPNPADDLSPLFPTKVYTSQFRPDDDRPPLSYDSGPSAPSRPADRASRTDSRDLEIMTVVELRQVARGMKRLHLKGREISKANKQQLIDAIKRVIDMD